MMALKREKMESDAFGPEPSEVHPERAPVEPVQGRSRLSQLLHVKGLAKQLYIFND
jgi:hypothetical protein